MKVHVDKDMPDLTTEEIDEIKSRSTPSGDRPGEFKKQMLGVKEIILSPQVARQLEEMGMTPDELVAMLLKKSGTSN